MKENREDYIKSKLDAIWEEIREFDSVGKIVTRISIPYEDYLDIECLPIQTMKEFGFNRAYYDKEIYLAWLGFSVIQRSVNCVSKEWRICEQ